MRRVVLTLLIVLITVILLEVLNFTGFCYSEHRYLSDEELIDAAIVAELRQHRGGAWNKKYESVADFRQQNPGCCLLLREAPNLLPSKSERFWGFYTVLADIWYRANQGTGANSFFQNFVVVNACGQYVEGGGIWTEFAPPAFRGAR